MEAAWYQRLIMVQVTWYIVSWLLFVVVKAERMTSAGPGKAWQIGYKLIFVLGLVWMWFIPFYINTAFWIGCIIIILGEIVLVLGYLAMRKHPEQKRTVVDWGIYKFSRNSHVMAGIICLFGTIIAGWNPESPLYWGLWVYCLVRIIQVHMGVLSEENLNIKRFGQEYIDYMKKTPRYAGFSLTIIKRRGESIHE